MMNATRNLTSYKHSLSTRILDEAIAAFAKRGVKAVKMDDIASALSISKRTLYEIYGTKEELLLAAMQHNDARRQKELADYAQDAQHDVIDIIIYLYRSGMRESRVIPPTFFEEVMKYPKIVAFVKERKARQKQDMQQFLRRGVDEGFFRSDINYSLVAHIYEALGRYFSEERLFQQYTLEELFRNVLFLPLRGFCTVKGIEKLDTLYQEKKDYD